MGNVCLSCNIKEGLTDFNYAGFKVTEEYYSFPSRIKAPKIPGVRKKQFLCNSCVNTFDVVCSVHGVINKHVLYNTTEDMKKFNNLIKMSPDRKRDFIRSEFIKYAKYEFPK